jgi:tRNA A-37 threonylcarbamoyl transferase component Bud32
MDPIMTTRPAITSRILNRIERFRLLFSITLQPQFCPPKELQNITSEHMVAEWDQENRICFFQACDLPGLAAERIEKSAFIPRQRNRLQLVRYQDKLAIRKQYQSFSCFTNEALALYKLNNVHCVPDLLGINLTKRTLYLSHIPGKNLGSLLASKGVSIEIQHELNGVSNRKSHDQQVQSKQLVAHTQLNHCVDRAFLTTLQQLVESIHETGIILRDVKYGNVLIQGESPFLCDFDSAVLMHSRSREFLEEREMDHRRFDFLFGQHFSSTPS